MNITRNKIITVLLAVAVATTGLPDNVQALRPMSHKVSVPGQGHLASKPSLTPASPQESADSPTPYSSDTSSTEKSNRREFLKAIGAIGVVLTIVGMLAFGIYRLIQWNREQLKEREQEKKAILNAGIDKLPHYPPERPETPLAQRIANLDASELAERADLLFGKNDRYKEWLFHPDAKPMLEAGERPFWHFIQQYTIAEIKSLLGEALGERLYDYKLMDEPAVKEAIYKKADELLRSPDARPLHVKMEQVNTNRQRLVIFLGIIENLKHASRYVHLLPEEFKELLESNKLGQVIEASPQILTLSGLLNVELSDIGYSQEEALKNLQPIVAPLNEKLFRPHGFYASADMLYGYLKGRISNWLFRIRTSAELEGEEVIITQRTKDDGSRLNAVGFSCPLLPDEPAIVLHEEIQDREEVFLAAIKGKERYTTRPISDDTSTQREFERQITLMFIKAVEENTELWKLGAYASYREFATSLHELAHVIRDTTREELVPYLIELSYGEPHIEAETMFYWMMKEDDWIYRKILAPITGLQEELPYLAVQESIKEGTARNQSGENFMAGVWLLEGDRMSLKIYGIAKFRAMSRLEIQNRARRLLRIISPAVYEAFESEEGRRFRQETLRKIKEKNMGSSASYGLRPPAEIPKSLSMGILAAALLQRAESPEPVSRRSFISFGLLPDARQHTEMPDDIHKRLQSIAAAA